MRKIEELLVIIFILGLITGIIPAIGVALMYKFPILIIPVLIFDFYLIIKELCYGGEQNYEK